MTKQALRDAVRAFDATAFGDICPMPGKWGKPSFAPPAGVHPRLMFLKSELDALRKKLDAPDCAAAKTEWLNLCAADFDGILPPPVYFAAPAAGIEAGAHNYKGRDLGIIEAKAFAFAVLGDEQRGLEAVLAMKNYLAAFRMEGRIQDGTRIFSHMLLVVGEVYDWCYDLLEAEDRRQLLAAVQNLYAPLMEIGFPPSRQGAITGHGGEAQLMRDWLALAIACYDEYTDPWDFTMGRIENEFVPARNFMYRSGVHHQGAAYGPYRYCFEAIAALMVRPFGIRLFGDGMEETMATFLHWLRPDGSCLRIGDDFNQKHGGYSLTCHTKAAFYASALFHNGVFKGFAREHMNGFTEFSYENDMITPTQFLAYHDADTPDLPLSALPTVCKNGHPLGSVILRSGWDADAAMAYMKIGESYAANHEHMDAGSFQLFHGGILASDSGVYDWYFSEEDASYNKMTVAHNCLLIHDPDEPMNERVRNSGGQRTDGTVMQENVDLGVWMEKGTTRRARMLDLAAKPGEYASISGDLTAAYHPDKCKSMTRRMLSVLTGDPAHPMYFFVFDEVESKKPEQKKTFLLHMETEPEIAGDTVIIRNGGTLHSRTLLPQRAAITALGGEGREFLIDGKQMEMRRSYPHSGSIESGWGRVEISPADENTACIFLHAMYTGEGELAARIVDCSSDAVGAALPGCIAAFARTETLDALTLTAVAPTDVYLVGAAPGYWRIRVDGADYAARAVLSGDHLLKFRVPAGSVHAERTAF